MKILEFKPTDHSDNCCDTNYYSNSAHEDYETWNDFKELWIPADIELNYIFRFDLYPNNKKNVEDSNEYLALHLYFILQRKGKFVPVTINQIKEEDMKEITTYLQEHEEYSSNLWKEFRRK